MQLTATEIPHETFDELRRKYLIAKIVFLIQVFLIFTFECNYKMMAPSISDYPGPFGVAMTHLDFPRAGYSCGQLSLYQLLKMSFFCHFLLFFC
jgi:hypothetical protein